MTGIEATGKQSRSTGGLSLLCPRPIVLGNGGVYVPFSLNITSFVVNGANTLTFTHANWDCSISDNVRNLQVLNG
jgi:hypothetical protein